MVVQPKDFQLHPWCLQVNPGTEGDPVGKTLPQGSWTLVLEQLTQLVSWGTTECPKAVVMQRETVESQGVVPTHCQRDGGVLSP